MELPFNEINVPLQDAFNLLLLYLKRRLKLLEAIGNEGLEVVTLSTEPVEKGLNVRFVDFPELVLLNKFVHVYQTFCSDLNLLEDVCLHADIVIFMLPEESAIRANSFLVVNADDLELSLMSRAQGLCELSTVAPVPDLGLVLNDRGALPRGCILSVLRLLGMLPRAGRGDLHLCHLLI